jgi:hypothetical protein
MAGFCQKKTGIAQMRVVEKIGQVFSSFSIQYLAFGIPGGAYDWLVV